IFTAKAGGKCGIFLQEFALPAIPSTVYNVQKTILTKEGLSAQPATYDFLLTIHKFYGSSTTGKILRIMILEPYKLKYLNFFLL
ncbi:MAG TPA: hypothetical protein PLV76_09240, partial [Spirochaetales bacterium]|nr:hypothetical protein [Spirochaetales bacterium]